ncbi:putative NADH-flavin reductase [Amycolatopsis bartoniae]|uniref:NADH-flavin reductase n=1 Tax=Amycolatopsis bartoniae TaxID=941986 RepID=A0A8H9J2B3_9PSEU|nr:SDR family oxidoreductase [Amycolatopsis bartoniae]MBB2936096.1 putative NADH-flavin reductase [Amycolatopsis bartoniae]TVS98987.1 SDR family oxidoreductase [Amycolatopsis bartoniae]GHF64121.1 NADH-flavin reductase [Amycolatopsis bartoniae]
MSRILVFGAAGRTGQVVVEEALRAGHEVTAAVRRPRDLPCEVVRADVLDVESVRAAAKGHDAVVSAIGPAGRKAAGLYSGAARTFTAALPEAGVSRLVVLSSAGVRHDDPAFALWYRVVARTLLNELYGDMREMESILRESTLDWTSVRPARITDDEPTGDYRVGDGATPAGGREIPRADLARFILGALDEPRWVRSAPTLAR